MVGLIWFFQAQLIHFNCPSLAGNHIIAFPLTSAQAVQAAPRCAAHSPSPASLAGRCHPSLTNFPALANLPGPCSLFQHSTSKAQMRHGQILGCRGIDRLRDGGVNAFAFFPPRTSRSVHVLLPPNPPPKLKSRLQFCLHFANKTRRSPSCLTSARPHFHVPDSFQGLVIPGCLREGGELPQQALGSFFSRFA